MKVFVKICGLRNAEDVAAAVDVGADAVGFVFADSVRRVTPEEAQQACENLRSDIKRVAVMLHPANEEWQGVLRGFAADVLQTDASDFASLNVPDYVERWPVIREGSSHADPLDTFVYEGAKSGSGETVDWGRAADMAGNGQMILAGGLSADNVASAISQARPFGVDVSSGVESAPGRKDVQRIRQFVSAVRAAEKNL